MWFQNEKNGAQSKINVVPWQSWDEWEEVYHALYSGNNKLILWGCNRVNTWSIKQEIPAAIEATSSILKAMLFTKNVSALSIAIIRLVNAVAEPIKKSNIATPISAIGDSVGIPSFIVNLRHAATHGQMPTLEFAISAGLKLIDWLKEHYWEYQLSIIENDSEIMKKELMSCLLDGKKFSGFTSEQVYYFCVPELLKLILNDHLSKSTVSSNLIDAVCSLIQSIGTDYYHFSAALGLSLTDEVSKGNPVAAVWLNTFIERKLVPELSVSRLISWADPSKINIPVVHSLYHPSSNPRWPPTSIGKCPIYNDDLFLKDDEFEILQPSDGQIEVAVQQPESAPEIAKEYYEEPSEQPIKQQDELEEW